MYHETATDSRTSLRRLGPGCRRAFDTGRWAWLVPDKASGDGFSHRSAAPWRSRRAGSRSSASRDTLSVVLSSTGTRSSMAPCLSSASTPLPAATAPTIALSAGMNVHVFDPDSLLPRRPFQFGHRLELLVE